MQIGPSVQAGSFRSIYTLQTEASNRRGHHEIEVFSSLLIG
jgi:hypothetical protein